MSDAKTVVVRRVSADGPYFHDGTGDRRGTWIHVPDDFIARELEVTIKPRKSKRERQVDYLESRLPVFTGYDRREAALSILAGLEAIDKETP